MGGIAGLHRDGRRRAGNLRNPDKAFAATNDLRTRGTDNLLAAAARLKTEEDPPDWRPIRPATRALAAMRRVEENLVGGCTS